MKIGSRLGVLSHVINFLIFVYFAFVLIQINFLDITGLLISAFGLFISLVANIVSVLEERKWKEIK